MNLTLETYGIEAALDDAFGPDGWRWVDTTWLEQLPAPREESLRQARAILDRLGMAA